MRIRALSVLRARQLIIEQCRVTINCFDVATHLVGLPASRVAPTFELERSRISETGPFLHLDRLCRRA